MKPKNVHLIIETEKEKWNHKSNSGDYGQIALLKGEIRKFERKIGWYTYFLKTCSGNVITFAHGGADQVQVQHDH